LNQDAHSLRSKLALPYCLKNSLGWPISSQPKTGPIPLLPVPNRLKPLHLAEMSRFWMNGRPDLKTKIQTGFSPPLVLNVLKA
jgi:hypothetical protein